VYPNSADLANTDLTCAGPENLSKTVLPIWVFPGEYRHTRGFGMWLMGIDGTMIWKRCALRTASWIRFAEMPVEKEIKMPPDSATRLAAKNG